MLRNGKGKFKHLVQGGLTAALLAASPFGAHAANINISVASNFYISGTVSNRWVV